MRTGYGFPSLGTEVIPLQGPLTQLDGAAQLSVIAWFKLTGGLTATQAVFTRYKDVTVRNEGNQWFSGAATNPGLNLFARTLIASADALAYGSTSLSTRSEYKATYIYDGTQAAANRIRMYLSVRSGDDTFSSDATETITYFGNNWPVALSSPADSTLSAVIGGSMGTFEPFNGQVDELRVWIGNALSYSSVTLEQIQVAPVTAPSLRYTFEPTSSTSNSGSLSGFTAQPTSLVTLVTMVTQSVVTSITTTTTTSVSTTTSIFALPAWTSPTGLQSAWVSV